PSGLKSSSPAKLRLVRGIPLVILLASSAYSANLDASNAQRKLDAISNLKIKRGSAVEISPPEVNAWIRDKAATAFPKGMRDIRIDLGYGTVEGYAIVDLLQIAQAKGREVNGLLARMIEGERPLKISLRIESASGQCTVYLTRVELSGVSISGGAL